MRKNNIINRIICLILILGLSIETCYARTLSFIGQLVDSGGTPSTNEEIEFTAWQDYPSSSNDSLYQFRYKKEINTATEITMNAYNLDGESVIPYDIIINPEEYSFKSGTWIGINTTEVHAASWKVYSIEYQEVKKKYTCTYTKPESEYPCAGEQRIYTNMRQENCARNYLSVFKPYNNGTGLGDCTFNERATCYTSSDTIDMEVIKPYNEEYTCPEVFPANTAYVSPVQSVEEVTNTVADQTLTTQMKNKAISDVSNAAKNSIGGTTGSVKYITNNKYPENLTDLKYSSIEEGTKISESGVGPTEAGGVVYGSYQNEYELLEPKVCMNVKTSEVTYGRDCDTKSGEIQISNGTIYDEYLKKDVNYWHYFIPLNAKSDSEFTLDIVKNGNRIFPVDQCEEFMKNNTDYNNYIVPTGNLGIFEGDYARYEDKTFSLDYNKLQEGNGCHISTKIYFPISQEFYNEVDLDENKKIKGFNFYYKPIDINNPFPNDIPKNSIWYNWSQAEKKEPDLSKSYDEVTYIASNIDASKVRKYTQKNPYTSWSNMNLDGTSKFIDDEGIVARNDKTNFYILGCGPANTNEYLEDGKTKNILYQSGCKK